MPLIRCTVKLLKEIGVKNTDLINDASISQPLGDWYANLLWINRRKCILFTNEGTLYSFMVYGVMKSDLKNFGQLFLLYFRQNLEYEGFGSEVIEKALKEYDQIGLGRTENRSVLGSMNDYAYQYEFHLREYGNILNLEMLRINHEMNRTPMGAIGYAYGIDKLKVLLGQ